MIYALAFLASGLVVVLAGIALARYSDQIADATGLGRLWIGSVLLAGATSLPELATDVFAVRMGAIDLALGNVFGACMANMLILALIDLMPPRQGVLQRAALDHALAASLAIALNAFAAALVLVQPTSSILSMNPGSILIFVGYLAGTRVVYRQAQRDRPPPTPDRVVEAAMPKVPLAPALRRFAWAALVVLLAAPAFAWSAQGIAEVSGLGDTLIGTTLLGLATTLPELVTCLAAVRMGAFDLAVGNLFGSNAINMAIVLPLDLAQPGSLFAAADPAHAVSGLFGAVLMALGLAAIVYRAKHRFALVEPDSVLMVIVYGAALWLLYQQSVPS